MTPAPSHRLTWPTASTYVDAIVKGPKGFGTFDNFGWYDDRLSRGEEGWCIAHRRATMHGARLAGVLRVTPPTVAGRLAGYVARRARKLF